MSETINLVVNIQYKQPTQTSSQIAAYGYDTERSILGVKFINGAGTATYHYFDVPQEVALAMDSAESLGKFIGQHVKGKFRYEKQPDEPGGPVFGLLQQQEPKYTIGKSTGRVINRSTGRPIPDDEPIFVFRAKDRKALAALWAYYEACESPEHKTVVKGRICDFEAFAMAHPDRMKEPDSSAQDIASAHIPAAH